MAAELELTVKYGKETLLVTMMPNLTVKDLMSRLQETTRVIPRFQKLIFKGKVLSAESTLSSCQLVDGAKIMMMAVGGTPETTSKGAGAASAWPAAGKVAAKPRSAPPAPALMTQQAARESAWEKTGIVSLRDVHTPTLPPSVWQLASKVTILDLSNTALQALPDAVVSLVALQRLNLSHNALDSARIAWDALTGLQLLTLLAMDDNRISELPATIGRLRRLRGLSIARNCLAAVPREMGELTCLEHLDVSENQLREIPGELAGCSALIELHVGGNQLRQFPETLGQLKNLKAILADNNALEAVPGSILRGCTSLHTLSVHGNQITIEQLREVDGWGEFDARRRLKYDRQLDFNIAGRGFDEGVDASQWKHW
eukprot:jgi/Mesvir1/17290/Mv07692-RA.1